MCTLWQRLGRAARNRALFAIAIIFVESKYFDSERARKEARKQKKLENGKNKHKQMDSALTHPCKRRQTTPLAQASHMEVEENPGNLHGNEAEEQEQPLGSDIDVEELTPTMREERRSVYMDAAISSSNSTHTNQCKVAKTDSLPPELDDLVNADTRGFHCCRIPIQLYFNNDRIHMWLSSFECSHMTS